MTYCEVTRTLLGESQRANHDTERTMYIAMTNANGWARNTNPVTAIRNAIGNGSSLGGTPHGPVTVQVWETDDPTPTVDGMGRIHADEDVEQVDERKITGATYINLRKLQSGLDSLLTDAYTATNAALEGDANLAQQAAKYARNLTQKGHTLADDFDNVHLDL